MPGHKAPVELAHELDWSAEENYKTESLSSRSSSPKSLTESWASSPISISEASESPEGSIISDTETEADRIANDLDNMKITEIQAEEMMKEGADMRHVLKAAYELKPKCLGKMKFKKGTKLAGRAVLSLLNFDNYKEKEEEVEQRQRMSRAWAEYEHRQTRGKGGVRPPPGFESLDQVIVKKFNDSKDEQPDFLVSYANGTNTLNLASQPITVHDVTVSCVVDSCRVFLQHIKNPTFEGLKHLEAELFSNYTIEQPKALLRPIAQGSVLAVFSDSKWYRCQVVSFNAKDDTCDIKFVDHGGYTTVAASDLRQMKPDFLRLPFQAIEVYLAHVNPSTEEVQTDITSEILFHGDISIKLLGQADDGIPMIQAYYYDGDYINIFTQEIIEACNMMTETNISASPSSSEEPAQEEELEVSSSPEELNHSSSAEEVAPQSYDTTPYSAYPYYCPETGYTHYSNTTVEAAQPTIAYCYQDAQGMQQIYYVAGPYILPTPVSEQLPASSPASEESSEISFGFSEEQSSSEQSSEVASSVAESSSSEEEAKPFEEWTQEDYARYYGL